MFVRLTSAFKDAICQEVDPLHPFGGQVVIVKGNTARGQEERPVYEVGDTQFMRGKIREGIIEEVRSFDDTPRNDPDHEDHPDNPDNQPALGVGSAVSGSKLEELIATKIAGLGPELRDFVASAIDSKVKMALAEQQANQQTSVTTGTSKTTDKATTVTGDGPKTGDAPKTDETKTS